MQTGKTRWTHDSIAYHLVWIPKYRRKVLTGEVQKAAKERMAECCERHDLTLLALETDQDHVPVFVSAPPRFSPAKTSQPAQRLQFALSPRAVSPSQARLWQGPSVDASVLCGHRGPRLSRNHPTLHHGMPGQMKTYCLRAAALSSPSPQGRWEFPRRC